MDEAESLLQQMDMEARSLSGQVRGQLQGRCRKYRDNINHLKADHKKALASVNAGKRDELFQGAGDDYAVTSMDQRTRLLASTDRLNSSTSRLESSHRTILQTEELGRDVLTNLHGQREQLQNTRDNLRKADDNIGRSSRVLRTMGRRVITNKIIMALIILVLLASILLIVYFKWIKKPSDDDDKKDKKKADESPEPSPEQLAHMTPLQLVRHALEK